MSDLSDLSADEEDLKELPEAVEDNVQYSDPENEDRRLQVYSGNFVKLSNKKKYESLTFQFSPEFIQSMIENYQKRLKELDRKNLPFWSFSQER